MVRRIPERGFFAWVPSWAWPLERAVVDRARHLAAGSQLDLAVVTADGPLATESARGVLRWLRTRPLRQPDQRTCASCALVLMRMLRDPAYADLVLGSPDPLRTFGRAALGMIGRTNRLRDASGRLQLPWPWIGGTRPAALVRMLHAGEGHGDPRLRYAVLVVDPGDPGPVLRRVVATLAAGEPVPLYVGDHRWMQHIVLAVGLRGEDLEVYDPARGRVVPVSRAGFLADAISVAGWTRPWLAVVPVSRR